MIVFPLTATDNECYIVEWEDPAAKKKSLQHRHMYGDKKKQRIRLSPKNILLWGASRVGGVGGVEESTTTTTHEEPSLQPQSSSSSSDPAPQKKSRPKRTPKKHQQEQQPQESPMDRFERLSREMAGQVDLGTSTGTSPSTSAFLPKEEKKTQFIQHKVKCPKGKKPGDILEFTNPHIPGQKQRVVIPPDAKPDKFFKVQVPLPTKQPKEIIWTCARCTQRVEPKADQDEQDETIDQKNTTNLVQGVPLRACAHY